MGLKKLEFPQESQTGRRKHGTGAEMPAREGACLQGRRCHRGLTNCQTTLQETKTTGGREGPHLDCDCSVMQPCCPAFKPEPRRLTWVWGQASQLPCSGAPFLQMYASKQPSWAQSQTTSTLTSVPKAWPMLVGEAIHQHGFNEYQVFPSALCDSAPQNRSH